MSSSHMRMKIHSITIFLLLVVACSTVEAQQTRPAASPTKPVFVFRGVGYFHRWSKNDQHEFTPEKQENLDRWSDMMTVNAYPDVHDGERLAENANSVLDNYKRHQAKVLKTDSIPRKADRPAEHVIAVVFGQISSRWHLPDSSWWMARDARSSIHIAFTGRKWGTR